MTPSDGTAAGSGGGEKSRSGDLEAERARWERETLAPALERHPERLERFITTSGQEVGRLYTALDNASLDYGRDIGFPGEYPYTRGIHATMHRGRLWTMRMFAGFGSARETNARFKYLLSQGQTGLSTAFDLPTLYGYDSDSPTAAGEFGECGVGVSSLEDMAQLFDGIPLDKVTTSMTINSPAAITWAMYIANAENNGVPRAKLGGTIQNDILKEFIAQKEYLYPPLPSLRLVTDTVEFGTREMPKWNTISISGYHIREAGSTAAQELAFTLADGFAYVDDAVKRGLGVDEFAPRLSFFFNAHNDFFEEIAKLRAARRIWARRMRDVYGAKSPESWRLRTHAQTAGVSLTAQQAENNIVRVAYQAMAAALGGTQSLHTNSMDETLGLPTEKAVRIALRTQQILAFESGVANTIDPLAGSYFVESLTDQLEREALGLFDEIDALGGVVPGIEEGWFQQEIAASAMRQQREVEAGHRVVVGVNHFTEGSDKIEIDRLKIDPNVEQLQVSRMAELRTARDSAQVERALARLREASASSENLVPSILDCARAYCTLHEIRYAMESVFGSYKEPVFF